MDGKLRFPQPPPASSKQERLYLEKIRALEFKIESQSIYIEKLLESLKKMRLELVRQPRNLAALEYRDLGPPFVSKFACLTHEIRIAPHMDQLSVLAIENIPKPDGSKYPVRAAMYIDPEVLLTKKDSEKILTELIKRLVYELNE